MFFNKKPLNKEEETALVNAIASAENQTSGEIRVHFENDSVEDPIARAKEVFASLSMNKTQERNGILFYVNMKQRKFAVWGDEGINSKVPDNFWDEIKDICVQHFKSDKFVEGLEKSIILCGTQLKTYFPRQSHDANELDNTISY
ncbi:MAG: Psb32 and founding protein of phosphatase [Bacteroidetes bacterium]|jgi:uncharacterized membrane protein|nr:Psb32 and founding protein of phosphatase [Bacteroidota bacterium]